MLSFKVPEAWFEVINSYIFALKTMVNPLSKSHRGSKDHMRLIFDRNFRACAVALLALTNGFFALAEDTYRTARGYTFTKVMDGPMAPAWRSPDGKVWSANQGRFSNAGSVSEDEQLVIDSPATEACARIGGRLPRLAEFKALAKYFFVTRPGNAPTTDPNFLDYKYLFPDFLYPTGYSMPLWTADAAGSYFARLTTGLVDPYGDGARSDELLSVCCVSP